LKGLGVEEVRSLLLGKVTLVAGHSGVGKSTLVNAIDPGLDLHTLEVSTATGKGQHTTTHAEMYELDTGGWTDAPTGKAVAGGIAPTFIIDTPGIKGFGLVDLEEQDIGDQFPEMFKLKGGCRFSNCLHKEEPGCAVRTAVAEGKVAPSRYGSYLDMLAGIDEESPYRVD
jgi:ribosome biogenesis GTPase